MAAWDNVLKEGGSECMGLEVGPKRLETLQAACESSPEAEDKRKAHSNLTHHRHTHDSCCSSSMKS